jgi:hypothetical protein
MHVVERFFNPVLQIEHVVGASTPNLEPVFTGSDEKQFEPSLALETVPSRRPTGIIQTSTQRIGVLDSEITCEQRDVSSDGVAKAPKERGSHKPRSSSSKQVFNCNATKDSKRSRANDDDGREGETIYPKRPRITQDTFNVAIVSP